MNARFLLATVLVSSSGHVLLACSNTTSPLGEIGGGASAGAGGQAGAGATNGGGGGAAAGSAAAGGSMAGGSCPAAAPANGDACTPPGLQCDYGTGCDAAFCHCDSGLFTCIHPLCPNTGGSSGGGGAGPTSTGGGGGAAAGGSMAGGSCPAAAPANGDACTPPGLQCDYGTGCDAAFCHCDSGLFTCIHPLCPAPGTGGAAGSGGSTGCQAVLSSNLPGVQIVLDPVTKCTFTLAEIAAGVKFTYRTEVTEATPGVAGDPGSGGCNPPPVGTLYVAGDVDGGGQHYCLCDQGLCAPHTTPPAPLVVGSFPGSFSWDGRNWNGPSDTGNPEGPAFPPGVYTLSLVSKGEWQSSTSPAPFKVSASLSITLVP